MRGIFLGTPGLLKDLIFISFSNVCMCAPMCGCVQVSAGAHREWGLQIPGAGVTGSREPPSMGAGNWTWFLCKNSMCS